MKIEIQKKSLFQGERIDEIGFNDLRLIQKPEDFCYGLDAVILADFAATGRAGNRIMDLGTGTGIIPIILSHKTDASEIYGLEVQADSYSRACRNVELNGLSGRIKILQGDVAHLCENKAADARQETFNAMQGAFDTVVSNPPYMKRCSGLTNHNEAKMIARHETTAGLEAFVQATGFLLKDKGDFYMVHRPSRLVDICVTCRKYRLEPKTLRFVSPNKESKPNIILVHCVKNGGTDLRLCHPLYVYDETGNYTKEIESIYERQT